MSNIGERLIRSAEQALAIVRGEADPATFKVFVPPDVDVASIRRKLGLTQSAFAQQFGLPMTNPARLGAEAVPARYTVPDIAQDDRAATGRRPRSSQ